MRVLQEVEFVNSASRIPLREVLLPVGNSTHNSVHRAKKTRNEEKQLAEIRPCSAKVSV